MKKITVMMGILSVLLLCQNHSNAQAGHSFCLIGLQSRQVPLSTTKMTSLIFPVAIQISIKTSKDVAVQKVKGADNVLELKALRSDFTPTNLSVYGRDGKLYSLDLFYQESPAILNYAIVNDPSGSTLAVQDIPAPIIPVIISGLPVDQVTLADDADSLSRRKGFLHKHCSAQRMHLRLKGIYIKDSVMWFSMSIHNNSEVPYHPDYFRMYVVDRKRAKRTAIQQVMIDPIYQQLPQAIIDKCNFSVGFPLFTIGAEKKLLIQISESGGGRLLELPITSKTLLRAQTR